jgi:hypothetical protein
MNRQRALSNDDEDKSLSSFTIVFTSGSNG